MSSSPGRAWPIHPVLFAAYAVLFLFAGNVAEVGLQDVIPPLGRSMIGAVLALSILGLLYRDMRRGALVTSVLVAAFFGYGHVKALAGPDVSREALLGMWAVLIAVVAILAWRLSPARIASLTKLQGAPMARSLPGVPKPILTPLQTRERTARRTIAALGYNECVTYSFIDQAAATHFGGGSDAVRVDNPISSEMTHLRPDLLPGLLRDDERDE